MTKRVETYEFSVDKAIVAHLILSQSDTLPKSIMELVMNAIGAGAGRIDIQVEEDGTFSVSDDRHGFRSKDEVQAGCIVEGRLASIGTRLSVLKGVG